MFLPVHLLDRFLSIGAIEKLLRKIGINGSAVIYVFSVAVFSFLQIFIFADRFIYSMYNFHINGFIWNIVFTTGGLDSLGAESQTKLLFLLMVAGFTLLQSILLIFSKFLAGRQLSAASHFVRPAIIAAITDFRFFRAYFRL